MLSALAMATDARPARPHGHLHGVPQPGAHGQDVVDDRRDQRRPLRARHRGRLEGGGVAGLRLRLPDARRADGGARRPPRGHPRDARAGPGDATRAGTPHVRGAINVPRASRRHASRSSSAATARGSRPGYAIRTPTSSTTSSSAREIADADGRRPRALRDRGPRPGDAPVLALRPRRGDARRRARPGSTRSAGFAEIGLDRIVCFPTRWSPTLEAQAAFAEDCRAAGFALEGAPATAR